MRESLASLKAAFIGLALVAAFTVAPAFAYGTPTITDTGSSFWTVRASGYNFSPGGWVYVESVDKATGVVSSAGWVTASNGFCGGWYCFLGGTWSYYGTPNTQCGPGRYVYAYDWGTAADGYGWVGPISVGCS
jgi:hypothetical protein